jgi:hypothetical protein
MSTELAYGYLSLPQGAPPEVEPRLRRQLLEYARLEGLDLRQTFVDDRHNEAFGFDAVRAAFMRRADVRTLVVPDLDHLAHIPHVAGFTPAELGRHLGVAVRVVTTELAPPPRRLAVGLVHRPVGTAAADLIWARSLVVRHAREAGLQLVDVLDLRDGHHQAVLARIADAAAARGVTVLVTDGLDPQLAERLAADLGLAHHAAPQRRAATWGT